MKCSDSCAVPNYSKNMHHDTSARRDVHSRSLRRSGNQQRFVKRSRGSIYVYVDKFQIHVEMATEKGATRGILWYWA